MGILRRSRTGRITRTTRPTALLSAAAMLVAALFLCLGSGSGAAAGPDSDRSHATISAAVAPGAGDPAYVCPYDSRHCGAFPHLSPAVLSAPLPAGPVDAEPQHFAPGPVAHPGRATDALPRSPGRHVLQVMRT